MSGPWQQPVQGWIILEKTQELRETNTDSSYRSFRHDVEAMREKDPE
jgi:hypothetical protein